MDSHQHPFVLCTPEGRPWRRSNVRQRYRRPAWDGQNMNDPRGEDHTPPILPWFTLNEGRHTDATWLAEDGMPEVARRARLGQWMVLDVLEARWMSSLIVLTPTEQTRLCGWFPHPACRAR